MEAQLHKPDQAAIDLNGLMMKILQKEIDEKEGVLCAQETLRLISLNRSLPLLQALLLINQDITRVLTMFFRTGFLLGRAIHKNSLDIHIIKDQNASSNQDTTSHSANHSTNTG